MNGNKENQILIHLTWEGIVAEIVKYSELRMGLRANADEARELAKRLLELADELEANP